ncbi:hypothetical protein K435DRAFT_641639 [Dendrothele bispora CBS 962.96]|uniref:Zona occludens toxin N-terminal domain-containing protein n=1 Tax=Dendrothele bispora (strain CBS 962.96) TaxID=1314807 RepID=A0A4S8MZQ3_DENBC|nr:hypothetical protein K435DRAFT_641639 [Dendrothele bispora CBS 962.96]
MTREAYSRSSETHSSQYGLMGKVLSCYSKNKFEQFDDPRLYLNTNAPFSAVVCGVQGSGKSHTVSLMLENMLITGNSALGSLQKPLSGLVLHFGEGGAGLNPCEAAWVGLSNDHSVKPPSIRVFVSKSSLSTMKSVYKPLTCRGNVSVEPLLFHESELDAQAFLSMMAVGSSSNAPLYMQIVLSILRELGENFSYDTFLRNLERSKKNFNPAQLSGLEQRMTLLKSFMVDKKSKKTAPSTANRFAPGQLTIIDLSDPFIDPSSACGLFEVITRLFIRTEVQTGKVLVVDEAHKYLSPSPNSESSLTNALLSLARQQRHLAMRVIISTQEPTVVPPVLLDLCTISILHRFSSVAWWDHLIKHVSADFSDGDAFDKVVKLKTGEAIVLTPSGLGIFEAESANPESKCVGRFGRRYLVVKTRKRVTMDGGASILVLPQ